MKSDKIDCRLDSERRLNAANSERPAGTVARLTAAENRVLAHVSLAKTNKEIASTLGISPATVKRHLEKILTKLKLRNRVEAAVYGVLLNGCPLESRSSCGLRAARDSRAAAEHEPVESM
ncbi:MAG: helix-turn-helix transcriptional regulator [Deltaproteobacteria bacterium]|nr:helix-turn-helix transcriptional regulator [Deltaproteobacteria bacterium]